MEIVPLFTEFAVCLAQSVEEIQMLEVSLVPIGAAVGFDVAAGAVAAKTILPAPPAPFLIATVPAAIVPVCDSETIQEGVPVSELLITRYRVTPLGKVMLTEPRSAGAPEVKMLYGPNLTMNPE